MPLTSPPLYGRYKVGVQPLFSSVYQARQRQVTLALNRKRDLRQIRFTNGEDSHRARCGQVEVDTAQCILSADPVSRPVAHSAHAPIADGRAHRRARRSSRFRAADGPVHDPLLQGTTSAGSSPWIAWGRSGWWPRCGRYSSSLRCCGCGGLVLRVPALVHLQPAAFGRARTKRQVLACAAYGLARLLGLGCEHFVHALREDRDVAPALKRFDAPQGRLHHLLLARLVALRPECAEGGPPQHLAADRVVESAGVHRVRLLHQGSLGQHPLLVAVRASPVLERLGLDEPHVGGQDGVSPHHDDLRHDQRVRSSRELRSDCATCVHSRNVGPAIDEGQDRGRGLRHVFADPHHESLTLQPRPPSRPVIQIFRSDGRAHRDRHLPDATA